MIELNSASMCFSKEKTLLGTKEVKSTLISTWVLLSVFQRSIFHFVDIERSAGGDGV